MDDLSRLIRPVPDFPQPGITFRDITPLLLDRDALRLVVGRIASLFPEQPIDLIAAIESRGFVLGAPLAVHLGCGFVPIRKLGKLPRATISKEYALEYGSNHLEVHVDAIHEGQRVLLVDDVLATGGTARAAVELIRELGGSVVATVFLIELVGLGGRRLLDDQRVEALLEF